MKTTSNLQLIALACLSGAQSKRQTLYELMTEINHFFSLVDTPYSPGAFYPAMKRLSKAGMININPKGCAIERSGVDHLEACLLTHPLPDSLIGILFRIAAASILADSKLRTDALKRIGIEMIKFDQDEVGSRPLMGQQKSAPDIIRHNMANCLRRLLMDLRD